MKVGFIGLGKLGLPVALAMDLRGHDVTGHDINPAVMQKDYCAYLEQGPEGEPSLEPFLQKSNLCFGSVAEVVNHAEIIFVAVQTPHCGKFEGITPLPDERVDFDYTHLLEAVTNVSAEIGRAQKNVVLVIMSTVLPGTVRSKVVPLTNDYVKLCYSPSFIAMGTAMKDFLNPEFTILGVWDEGAANLVEKYFETIHSKPIYRTTVDNGELIKVSYNTFLGLKITFVNTLMEICHKTEGTDVDSVTDALKLATDRLISPKYLTGGMGDGGGCHPRDNIAMSWMARKLDLSYDLFESLMMGREKQAAWLTELMCEHDLPKVVLGKAYKPESTIELGSPSILCQNLLLEQGHKVTMYDPFIDSVKPNFDASVFLIGTKHPCFETFEFPKGSIVIDPWRYIPPSEGVTVIPVGGNAGVTNPSSVNLRS